MSHPLVPAYYRGFAIAATLLALSACTSATPEAPPAKAAPEAPAPVDSVPVTSAPEAPTPSKAEAPETALSADEDVRSPPPAVARWLLHSHRTAMLIEMRASLDEVEQALARVITAADQDKNGQTTWEELAEISEVFPRGDGNDALPPDLMRTYDTDGDDTVSAGELRRFLGRGELVISGWLAIQVDRRYERQLDSPTFRWLDQDNDGRLDTAEVESAPQRLLETDADDDGLVWPTDLAPLTPNLQPLPPLRTMSSANARRYICAIDEQTDWEELAFELEQRFSFGGALTTRDLPRSCTLSELDADGDGAISSQELQRLLTITPDLTLEVQWNPTRLTLGENPSETVDKYAHTTLNGVAVELFLIETTSLPPFDEVDSDQDGAVESSEFDQVAGLNIRFEAVDTDSNEIIDREEFALAAEVIEATGKVFVNARVFRSDDPLFAVLDVDKNARLDRREISGAIQQLQPLQTQQEGELDPNALAASISIAISNGLTNPNPVSMLNQSTQDQTTTAPAWFTETDLDGNGLISRDEFLGTSAQFEALDRNQDGEVTPEEAAVANEPT